MTRKNNIFLGCVFILASGLIYTLEKLREAIVFVGTNVSKALFQAYPSSPTIADLSISIIFFLISCVFFFNAIRSKQKE